MFVVRFQRIAKDGRDVHLNVFFPTLNAGNIVCVMSFSEPQAADEPCEVCQSGSVRIDRLCGDCWLSLAQFDNGVITDDARYLDQVRRNLPRRDIISHRANGSYFDTDLTGIRPQFT